MKKSLLLMGLAGLVFLGSCGKDDEPPPPPHPIVGVWELDGVSFYNVPDAYAEYWEGLTFPAAGFYGADAYQMEFFDDNTYRIIISLPSSPDFDETGTWVQEDEGLTLTPDDDDSGLEREYFLEGDITDLQLPISIFENFPLITDEVMVQIDDTVSSNIYNYVLFEMTEERFDELSDEVAVYFLHNFEKADSN